MTELSAEAVSPTAHQQERLVPVVFDEQPAECKEVFRAIIDGAHLTTCPTKTVTSSPEQALPKAFTAIQNAGQRQRERYEGDLPDWVKDTVYLRRDQQFYALTAFLSDVLISYPVKLPEDSTTNQSLR